MAKLIRVHNITQHAMGIIVNKQVKEQRPPPEVGEGKPSEKKIAKKRGTWIFSSSQLHPEKQVVRTKGKDWELLEPNHHDFMAY
ncbi:hypothetical protein A6R68_13746, partial [Neotoma lepida]